QNSEITIRSLQSYFRFSPSGIELLKLNLSTEKSFISDTLRFLYDSPLALGDFINSVDIDARLKKSYLHPDDLAKLFSAASKIKDLIYIEGNFYGTVNGFAFNNMQIKNGRSTLNGNIEMYGLPDLEDTFIDLNLRNSTLITSDIAMYMKEDVREKIDEFGRINFSGEFQGFIYDFVANGILDTQYGRIVSDINLKINQDNIDLSSYSGRLRTEKFNIGKLIGDTSLFQTISMNGRLNGKGLNIEKADLQLNGRISEIGIKGYNYVNINTNARFFSQFFNGYISIDDPNLKLSTEAKIDLRPQFETIQAKGTLDYVSFHNLNLSDKFFFLSSAIDINTKGLELDSLTGSVSLHNFNLVYDENELLLDSIDILSVRDGKNRYLSVHSSMADIEMEGDFIFTSFFKDISTLVFELGLQLKNDKQAIKEYYATKGNSPSDYDVNFKFNLHDINPVINLFTQDFEISKNILFQGEYYSGYNTMLTAYSNVDSIRYTNKYFTDNIIEFNGSKISDSTSVLAMFFMNSKSQNLTSKLFTRDLSIEGVWHEERIDFSIDAYQQNVSNFINISGDVNLRRDSTQIRFNPSRLRLLENMWNIERGNRILIKGREISVKNLNIFNQNENISINGFLSDDENKLLSIDFNNVSIDIINPLIGKDLGGTMQGYIEVKNIYQSITIQNRITIYNHTINNFLVGDVTGNNEWDNEYKVFEINLAVDRLGKRIVNIQGSYDPFIIGNQLNLKADFAEANLDIIEPFLDFFVSQIKGTITGSYSISGNFDLIKINGSGRIQNGQIMINYLKTLYGFNGNIGMDTDKIIFDNIELTDINGNRGRINGNLSHKNFSDLQINLDGRFNNFQVLNTTARDNELFYGIANASGDVNFFGPLGNMKITSNAKTERGTRISIPLTSSSASVETKEYINFLNFTDASATALIEESVKTTTDLSGLNIEFNIEITPDAYC
ncbi:MAG TPA: translocation/assembly module TamB domain-containing protein, partial [Cyclobacteriaceae bacterium]|nr:translocation/assembly module TamB domain-containing protein [Cyclobacteriaceae bacterium]